jgi:hypothetical protein
MNGIQIEEGLPLFDCRVRSGCQVSLNSQTASALLCHPISPLCLSPKAAIPKIIAVRQVANSVMMKRHKSVYSAFWFLLPSGDGLFPENDFQINSQPNETFCETVPTFSV